jgi:hypothetical protein
MTLITKKADFALDSGELKTFSRSSDSGRTVVCAFCPECGTRIYHVPAYLEGVVNVKPGTLDDTSWLAPTIQVWTSSRQPWLSQLEQIPSHPQQPH